MEQDSRSTSANSRPFGDDFAEGTKPFIDKSHANHDIDMPTNKGKTVSVSYVLIRLSETTRRRTRLTLADLNRYAFAVSQRPPKIVHPISGCI